MFLEGFKNNLRQFSPHFGVVSLLNYTESLEKNEINALEKSDSEKFKVGVKKEGGGV